MLVFLRHVITHNWILKTFSLLLAILMWFAIWSGSNAQMSRIVSLGFTNIPENMQITGQTDIQVTVQLQGSFDLLAGLSGSDITPTISLAGHEPGHKSVPILPGNIDSPTGVEVLGISPDRIEFDLERTIRKDVEIQASVEGDPAEGYFVDDTFVTPARMGIQGPESRVDPIAALSTAPIRIDGSTESLSASVNLDVPDTMIRLDSFAPVEVFIQILEIPAERTLEVPPLPALLETWDVDVDSLTVIVSGPPAQIESLDPEAVYFSFDAVSVGEDGTVVPNVIGLPEDVTVIDRGASPLRVTPTR